MFQVVGIRGGFNVAYFEFDEFVMVFEAPAGWLELHEIPARNFEKGATSSSVSRKLIDLVRQRVPDKPIRYLALSHFHGDHAGGVREFIAEGVTILAAKATLDAVEAATRREFSIHPDAQSQDPKSMKFEIVTGRRVVSDGNLTVELIQVPDNPHADGMIVLRVPDMRAVFVADLFLPIAIERFPIVAELPLNDFFVRWLDRMRLDPETIYAVHGGVGTREHLEKIRAMRE